MITYVKGDLFGASRGILAHACNTHGSWGGGVALQFKKQFPQAYEKYHDHCKSHNPSDLVDTCLLIPEGNLTIACLFTNYNDDQDGIVTRTHKSVADMLEQVDDNTPISMPMINSGIFGVPWPKTEAVLNKFNRDFTVYTI